MRKLGIPPENLQPDRYSGPRAHVLPCVEAKREPTTEDKLYPLLTEWRIQSNPMSGTHGEVWQLVKFETNGDAIWRLIRYKGDAIEQVDVDFNTAPGTDPVDPDANGLISIYGNSVTNGTNANAPVATHSRALNQFHIDVQLSTAVTGAPGDPYDAGLASFNDTQFTVDGNGYVSLVGGTDLPIVQTLTGDGGGAVGPNASGNIDIQGSTVANATNAKPLYIAGTPGSNLLEAEIQVATSLASAPADTNDAGICSFDEADFDVDSNGYVTLSGGGTPTGEGAVNLGLDLTSGRLQVTAADGSALSASNVGRVRVQTKGSYGQNQQLQLVKPYKIDDDSHSTNHDLEGWYPFWDSGDDWNLDRPYFLYVIQHDTPTSDPAVAISQQPNATISPAAGVINVSGTINDNTQESFFLFEISDGGGGWTTPTIANYDENPCVCIGSFRMQVTDTGNDDQTVQTLNHMDGIGQYQEGVYFKAPNGTIGSFPGFFATDPGGTDMTWSNGSCSYTVDRSGMVTVVSEWNTLTATNATASALPLLLPYYIRGVSGDRPTATKVRASDGLRTCLVSAPTSNTRTFGDLYQDQGTTPYLYTSLASSDAIGGYIRYLAFKNYDATT